MNKQLFVVNSVRFPCLTALKQLTYDLPSYLTHAQESLPGEEIEMEMDIHGKVSDSTGRPSPSFAGALYWILAICRATGLLCGKTLKFRKDRHLDKLYRWILLVEKILLCFHFVWKSPTKNEEAQTHQQNSPIREKNNTPRPPFGKKELGVSAKKTGCGQKTGCHDKNLFFFVNDLLIVKFYRRHEKQ